MLLPVQGSNGSLSLGIAFHFNKAEALAPTGRSVCNDLNAPNGPVR
jgi:hypothetical protein